MTKLFRYKTIRDPLYGFVEISERETRVIDTEVFRRLQYIKQLSHAYVVYPSAVHTRFEHSLGTTHVAGRLCSELELDNEKTSIVRLSALLHDIGHGPFSHLFEHTLQKINPNTSDIHEVISRSIIHTDCELDTILKDDKKQIIEILEKKKSKDWFTSGKSLLSDIVSGTLDADKFDYLRRDSYHIGVAYGQFDLERILHTVTSAPGKRPQLCMTEKGVDAIENYRIARYLMHAQVYEHHARLVADQMFLKALDIAIHQENVISPDILKVNENNYDSNKEFLEYYKTLDDNSIYNIIMNDPKSKVSKHILSDIKKRKLLKRACQFIPNDISDPTIKQEILRMEQPDLDKIANEVSQSLGIPDHEIIFYLSNINIKLYKDGDILFLDKNQQPHDVKESSPISAAKFVLRYYVFGPRDPNLRRKIVEKIAERLEIPSERITTVSQ